MGKSHTIHECECVRYNDKIERLLCDKAETIRKQKKTHTKQQTHSWQQQHEQEEEKAGKKALLDQLIIYWQIIRNMLE